MIRKTTLALALSLLLTSVLASADQTQGCIPKQEIQEISRNFDQLQRFTRMGNREEVCSDEMGSDWYQITASLMLLKNAAPDEPAEVSDDAFTFKAIQEKDWWAYFTNRASSFQIDNSCEPGVVAYVFGRFGGGRIYLCRPYFESNRSSQASVLMHEVRHFDGHRHVTCSRGNEKGNRGACDNRITGRGSYAISVQTLVGLSRSDKTEKNEKLLLESEAVYTAFNKFNVLPQLKMKDYMYLSNDKAEVYMWDVTSEKEPALVATLDEPAMIQNSFNRFTVYPLNSESMAYRIDRGFNEKVENPGLFAVHFNSLTPEQKAEYDSISYFGDGGLLANNKLQTLCNNRDLSTTDLSNLGEFTSMISLPESQDEPALKSHLLSKRGEIYKIECVSPQSSQVNLTKQGLKIDPQVATLIVESFTLGSDQYAMLNNGQMIRLNLNGNTYTAEELNLPIDNSGWVGANPLSVAEIFEEE